MFFDIYKSYLYYLVKSLSTIILDEIVFCMYIYILFSKLYIYYISICLHKNLISNDLYDTSGLSGCRHIYCAQVDDVADYTTIILSDQSKCLVRISFRLKHIV